MGITPLNTSTTKPPMVSRKLVALRLVGHLNQAHHSATRRFHHPIIPCEHKTVKVNSMGGTFSLILEVLVCPEETLMVYA